jgi:hypothetical protein
MSRAIPLLPSGPLVACYRVTSNFVITLYNIIIVYYNIIYYNVMGPLSYMRSVVNRYVVMRRMNVNQGKDAGRK